MASTITPQSGPPTVETGTASPPLQGTAPAAPAVPPGPTVPTVPTAPAVPTVPTGALVRPVVAVAALFVLILCLHLALDFRADATPESRAFAQRLDYEVWTVLLAGTVTLW